MGCQTAIAEQILARGADYLLVLKANHQRAYEAVVKHFDQACFRRGAPHRAACDTFDEAHGRLVRRRVFASTKAASLEALSGWPGLHTVVAVEALRSTNGTPTVETEIRSFLSSCRDDPVVLGRAIRKPWALENALHWVLDVTFREDDSRVRDQRAARNLAVLRRIAINLVGRDGSTKASVRARRKRAAWDNDDMLQLLAGSLLARRSRVAALVLAPVVSGPSPRSSDRVRPSRGTTDRSVRGSRSLPRADSR